MAAVRIDLHVHSSASDGTDPPATVVRRAARANLDVVALTDHDTQAGIAEARNALPPGLTLVPGIELSCSVSPEGRPPGDPPAWGGCPPPHFPPGQPRPAGSRR